MDRDFFAGPQEATEYGVIDTVISHRNATPAPA